MNDDQIMKLFKNIEELRREVREGFENTATKSALDSLTNTIDGFVKRIDDAETEQAARDAQFERLLVTGRVKYQRKLGFH